VLETATATRRIIFTGTSALISHTVYSPTGHVLFELPTGVWALPFSLRDRQATGEAFLVLPNACQPSVARDATLVMLPNAAAASDARFAWIDRSGKTLRMIGDARGHLRHPRLSPDGGFIAFVRGSGADSDVWIYDVTRAAERQLTFESTADFWPVWSPDSRHIVYHCNNAVCARRADGAGAPVQLVDAPATEPSVSGDGRWMAFTREVRPGEPDIFAVDLTATGFTQRATTTPRLVLAAPRVQVGPEISPDGRYVAYTSSEGGPFATFVSQFPSGEGKWQVPLGFSQLPRWSVKGDRLYVLDELRRIVELPVDLSASFEVGAPLTRISNNSLIGGYDVSRDGNEFLLPVAPATALASGRLLVVQNWKGPR
jgi:dipeptidyl aminopeptidase/acylaminoacyl peptidase